MHACCRKAAIPRKFIPSKYTQSMNSIGNKQVQFLSFYEAYIIIHVIIMPKSATITCILRLYQSQHFWYPGKHTYRLRITNTLTDYYMYITLNTFFLQDWWNVFQNSTGAHCGDFILNAFLKTLHLQRCCAIFVHGCLYQLFH